MHIEIRGANEHNLKDLDVDLEDGLTVVTGVSGSGKTSLVFDTLYHEARRRFLEIFSLGERLAPADVRSITGLGPAVAVGQNLLNRNPGSTLATASGLHPFLRLLYANFGERRCPTCGAGLATYTEDEIVARLARRVAQGPVALFAPLLRGARGSHRTLLDLLVPAFGAAAVWVDGAPYADGHPLDPAQPHAVAVEVARLDHAAPLPEIREAVQRAWALGVNAVHAGAPPGAPDAAPAPLTLSRAPVCAACGTWFGALTPVLFHRACPHCEGEGCERCAGTGLHPEAAAVRWAGLRLPDLLARSVDAARARFAEAELPATAERLITEITRRLDALHRVGLGYIGLDRSSPTLSRGEAQRVRLALALVSRLEDMLHILDEPTIGQHPADVARLLPAFRELAGPVIFVEHDRIAAACADHAVDLGPGAGRAGGELIFNGAPAGLWQAETPTGRHFSLRQRVTLPEARPAPPAPQEAPEAFLTVRGANLRTLRAIDVPIPVARLTVITGVSGSGKSTLVEDVLAASLDAGEPVGCAALDGPRLKAVMVDQSPIGKNPRSNPATYTKLAGLIRKAFSEATGLSSSHFSFNRPEGACPACKGIGAVEVKMRYLPSTWIPCAACEGQRFSDEVLAATADFGEDALSIADFFALPIAEAQPLLAKTPHLSQRDRRKARRLCRALVDIGLGYLTLGQASPTLSGGEAQRVKLAKFLGRRGLSSRLLILDEPSTGLHPQDVAGLLTVLDRLVRGGATALVVEHNTDVIRAADWVIDLGPGAGPEGGSVIYAGPPAGLLAAEASLTGAALREERASARPRDSANQQIGKSTNQQISKSTNRQISKSQIGKSAIPTSHSFTPYSPPPSPPLPLSSPPPPSHITIRGARAHNLRDVDVAFPKGQLTVVTGVSGSGKSSLVGDVLEAEARRRFLETLSMYERQGTREGPEAPVDAIAGLGVAVSVGTGGRGAFGRRNTVGTATEIQHHLAVLFAALGERDCPACGAALRRVGPSRRVAAAHRGGLWRCPACDFSAPLPAPRHFSPSVYAAACTTCHGVGTLREPNPEKLIVDPEKPLCGGAMYSPGFFPKGYLCKPMNGGYELVQALAEVYGFDPAETPWNAMAPEAREAFLFGYPEKLRVIHQSRNGSTTERWQRYPGFYGWIRDWDVGGTYTDTVLCPDCGGARLRPAYASVTLAGHTLHAMSSMPLARLAEVLGAGVGARESESQIRQSANRPIGKSANQQISNSESLITYQPSKIQPQDASLRTVRQRLHFLLQVGLGYLHLGRDSATLSAGEAQRVKLAGLLGSGLTSLTVLVDEPTRGMHPSEVRALVGALHGLRDEGNTVIVVEHDPGVIRAADYLVDVGPGAGAAGGEIVAAGAPEAVAQADTLTAEWLRGARALRLDGARRAARDWLVVCGARAHNLRGEDVRLPLGCLVGVCGVSGSGKSTLLIETLGRALAPKKITTSVAYEPVEPGAHDAIEGAPERAILVDQVKAGMTNPASFLGLIHPLHRLYAAGEDAQALGFDVKALKQHCSVCGGYGTVTMDMGFLPNVHAPCEACQGTGYRPEAWDVRLRGVALPDLFGLTLDEVWALFPDEDALARPLAAAHDVGLGYLVLRQPGYALSGGEAQRLKIAKELCRKTRSETLYILDEPTVGQHLEDVARLSGVLHRLVEDGHSVFVVEHHAHLLAACDWLVELGPGGGPEGGRVVAAGTPEAVARGSTPTARYLRAVLPA